MRSDYLISPVKQFYRRARRIVSEDSLCRVAALAATVHLLPKKQNLSVIRIRHEVLREQVYCLRKQLEVMILRSDESKPLEERDDAGLDIAEPVDLPIPAATTSLPHGAARQSFRERSDREPFLLIVCTRHIFTVSPGSDELVARDAQSFQHIAEFYNYLG